MPHTPLTPEPPTPEPQPVADPLGLLDEQFAESVARVVLAHPAVVELDAGQFGTVASYLVGRKVLGVRASEPGESVELSVVLLLGCRIPDVVAELRAAVSELAGDVAVHVTVSDLREPEGVRR